jgi:predicted porin
MQKKLIAIAIAAALAPAAAMADTSNVVVYGKMHLSYDRFDNDAAANNTASFVANNSSRLGFKGSEDLGDGMKAVWQLEAGIAADGETTQGALNSVRDTFVGLSGNFGTVTAGRQAWHNLYAHDANMFSDQIGAPSVWIDQGGRASNSIKYATPNMNGFDASITYVTPGGLAPTAASPTVCTGLVTGNCVVTAAAVAATGEGADDNFDSSYALKANYKNGPMYVTLTHLSQAAAANTSPDAKATSIAGGYDFGAGKVVAQYVRYSDNRNTTGVDYNVATIGGSYNVTGNSKIKAQYTRAGDGKNSATSTDDGADMVTVGYDYSLSKRTTAYAAYSRVSNDTNASYSVSGSGHGANLAPTTANKDPSVLSFGLVHDF